MLRKLVSREAPVEAPVDAPVEAPVEAPVDAPVEAPLNVIPRVSNVPEPVPMDTQTVDTGDKEALKEFMRQIGSDSTPI